MKGFWLLIGEEHLDEQEKSFLENYNTIKLSELRAFDVSGIKGIIAKTIDKDIDTFEKLLFIRTSRATYTLPCWIWGRGIEPFNSFLWPSLSRDYITRIWNSKECARWLEISSEGIKGLSFKKSSEGRLNETTIFEIIMTVAIENSTGTLKVVRGDGKTAELVLNEGIVIKASSGTLKDKDGIYDLLSWREGIYFWKPNLYLQEAFSLEIPLMEILNEYFSMVKENVQIFNLVGTLDSFIELKPSHCALDDPADPLFEHYKYLCLMLSRSNLSIVDLINVSSLSPIRTLFFVNRLISLGDATAIYPDYVAKVEGEVFEKPVERYKALIVDDAPFFLKVLRRILEKDERFEVIGTAKDGIECLEKVDSLNPDVITLDLEMPKLDGLGALKRIMIRNPKPVVVLSAFTGEISKMTYDAFKFGAVDVIEKPKNFSLDDMELNSSIIRERVARAAKVQIDQIRYLRKNKGREIVHREIAFERASVKDKLFVNVFGYGDFSHFIKVLFLLDALDFNASMIFVVPVRSLALKELVKYIQADCIKPVEVLDKEPMLVKKNCFYLVPYDKPANIEVDLNNDILVKETLLEDSLYGGTFRSLIDSGHTIFGSNLIVSTFSGSENLINYFTEITRSKGIRLLYLAPNKCLYPGLASELGKNGLGTEVEGLERIVEYWLEIINREE